METFVKCPVCGSTKLKAYSSTPAFERNAQTVHYAQTHCLCCDLVFSNPIATENELRDLYQRHYYEEKEKVYSAGRTDLKQLILDRAKAEAEGLKGSVLPYVQKGVFFEIGAGYGALMLAAESLGFESAGVEASVVAAEFGRQELGLKNLRQGLFDGDAWPADYCDVVYSYHVIEHVYDPVLFIRGIRRILKPGGLAVIGTENHHNAWVDYRRVRSWLRGRTLPEFQTADHHTFYFSDKSLGSLLKKEGFQIQTNWVYTHSLSEKLKNTNFRSIFSRCFFYFLHFSDAWSGRGGRLLIWCKKT